MHVQEERGLVLNRGESRAGGWSRSALPWWAGVPREATLNLLAAPHGLRRMLRRVRRPRATYDVSRGVRRALEYWSTREALFGKGFFEGKAILEIGSGPTYGLALCALAAGARQVANVEISGDAVVTDRRLYDGILAALEERGYAHVARARAVLRWTAEQAVPDENVLVTRYGTNARGLEFPDQSFDFLFSIAALEHVRRRDLGSALAEMHRVLRPGGLTSHRVDTCDHYQRHTPNPLDFLRYPAWLYDLMYSNRESFSNRYRLSDFVRLFTAAGFQNVRVRGVVRYEDEDTWRRFRPLVHKSFGAYSPEDLRVTSFLIEGDR